jgi:hypothetical protein
VNNPIVDRVRSCLLFSLGTTAVDGPSNLPLINDPLRPGPNFQQWPHRRSNRRSEECAENEAITALGQIANCLGSSRLYSFLTTA